jgi:hypothetical protein
MAPGGFIYALGIAGHPSVKIGKTRQAVAQRLSTLQTGQPEPLTLLAHAAVDHDLSQVEKAIHQSLAPMRLPCYPLCIPVTRRPRASVRGRLDNPHGGTEPSWRNAPRHQNELSSAAKWRRWLTARCVTCTGGRPRVGMVCHRLLLVGIAKSCRSVSKSGIPRPLRIHGSCRCTMI